MTSNEMHEELTPKSGENRLKLILAFAALVVVVIGAVAITFAVTRSDSGEAQLDGRSASAIAEVTSLEGTSATTDEHAFVDELASGMSRPYWDNGPEAMVLGYQICVAGTPSAAVFDLVDQGWSRGDAETFADAATKHLC